MNKDNLISAVFGILLGFIAGYLLHEVMASRQPPRFVPGAPNAMSGGSPVSPEAPAAPQQDLAAAQAQQQEMEQLEQLVKDNPTDAQAVRRLADLNYDRAQWPQAEALYSQFLKLEPGNIDVLSDLGVVYRNLQQYDKALETFDQVQRVKPGHWQSLYNKTIVLAFDKRQLDEAQKVLDELQKLQPGNPNVAQLAAEIEKQRNAA
ncbi:MAG TPA: tetratricopeptide repeat protein [Thermoanaerobaculia bacterium]|nr:tetratricopeptide repeat protein [Thermoanaerobaculia bacterium]